MSDDEEPMRSEEPEDGGSRTGSARPAGRPVPGGPGARTEKALGLEVARLFGLSPRLLMTSAPEPEAEHDVDPEEDWAQPSVDQP